MFDVTLLIPAKSAGCWALSVITINVAVSILVLIYCPRHTVKHLFPWIEKQG